VELNQVVDDGVSALTTPAPTPGSVTVGSSTLGGNAGHQFGQRSRFIGMFHTGSRMIVPQAMATMSLSSITSESNQNQEFYGSVELDSHADTCTVGANFRFIAHTEKSCNVTPFHPHYQSLQNVPIVQAATAYTDPESGETFILIVNQALYMGPKFQTTLLNPNQLRSNGIIVDDCPKHLAADPAIATHSVFIPCHSRRIPLELNGVISGFQSHYPSTEELENCLWIELTSHKEWDPHSREFSESEKDAENDAIISIPPDRSICSIQSAYKVHDISQCLYQNIMENVHVGAANTTAQKHSDSLRNKVSRIFGVGLETADRTLLATMQLAI
jgi:hypothetical protein